MLWLPVRSEAHHLELIAVVLEAEVLRHGRVHQAEGVWKIDLVEQVQLVAASNRHRRADEIAEPIDRAASCVVERRDEEGARKMSRMVLHIVDPGEVVLGKAQRLRRRPMQFTQLGGVAHAIHDQLDIRSLGQRVNSLLQKIRLRVPADGDMRDLASLYACHVEDTLYRLCGEARPVLDASESFFLDGGNEHSVAEESRRDVAMVGVDSEDVDGFGHGLANESDGRAPVRPAAERGLRCEPGWVRIYARQFK